MSSKVSHYCPQCGAELSIDGKKLHCDYCGYSSYESDGNINGLPTIHYLYKIGDNADCPSITKYIFSTLLIICAFILGIGLGIYAVRIYY